MPQPTSTWMVIPKKGNQQEEVHCIGDIQRAIGEIKDVFLTVYAFTGCDTVSSIYKKGKIAPFKKVQGNKDLRTKLLTFNDPNADPDAIAVAGNHFFLSLFASKHDTDDLDTLRHQCYLQTIARQPLHSMCRLAVLPPTSEAAEQHSYSTQLLPRNYSRSLLALVMKDVFETVSAEGAA